MAEPAENSPAKTLRVAAVQFQHAPGDKSANLDVIRRFVEQAAAQRVQLICFPECCISGYWHLRHLTREQLTELAEPVFDGPAAQFLMSLAQRHQMTIGAGLVELGGEGGLYNTYVVAMPDGRFARHRKLHVFVSEYLTPGDQYTVFDTPHGWRVGMLICYDNNIVENARATALAGAELLLAPHQTGGCDSGSPHGMKVIDRPSGTTGPAIRRRSKRRFAATRAAAGWCAAAGPAHDNGMFLAFSNGVGPDDNEVRTGNAMILDPYGRILTETCKAGDDMVIADLDSPLRER